MLFWIYGDVYVKVSAFMYVNVFVFIGFVFVVMGYGIFFKHIFNT